jgi:integrase
MKLTTANIELPKGKSDHIVFDEDLIGFGLRIRSGSGDRIIRNWIVQYRQHGRGRRMIVGSAEKLSQAEARKKARKLLAEVELGGDPQSEKKERRDKDSLSLRSVVTDYLDYKTNVKARPEKERTTRPVKEGTMRMLKSYLEGPLYLGSLRSLPIDRISRKDIAARLLAVTKASGAPTAIAFRSALGSMFTWAMQMGLLEINPVVGAFKPPSPKSRDRVLVDAELSAIWRGLDNDDYGKCVELLILTGCRRAEIAGMRWSEFSDDRSTWTLPKERSKNGKAHTLPLTPLMLKIIDSIPERDGFDLLFGRKHGFTGWSIGKRALDERLGLPPWRVHDIRRSVSTGMNDIGIQPHIVEQVLNHQSGHRRGTAGTYNRSVYANEVVSAMLRWSDHIGSIIEGGERRVLAFPQATA